MSQRAEPENREESLAVGTSYVVPSGTPTDEQFEVIRERFIDERKTDAKPEDLFAFQLIACSDGLDSYFTRHDIDTGLKHFVEDLGAGQSVLGNHDYRTFSYGSSYLGKLAPADPKAPYYEATAFREHDEPGLRTSQVVIGDYFIVRDVELNGQDSNALIRAMEFGAVRKTSITFSAGEFICSVCGRELLDGLWSWDGVDDDGNELCLHFPGVTYERDGKRVLCWALMKHEELYETSMVYKNASPSSMYLRKAEALAARGMLPGNEMVKIEQRLNMRLPTPGSRQIWTPGGVGAKEVPMAEKRHEDDQPTPAGDDTPAATGDEKDKEGTKPATTETTTTTETETTTKPDGDEPAEEEHVEATTEVSESVTRVFALRGQLGTAELETLADSERQLESILSGADSDRSVGAMTARQYEARDTAMKEALGGEAPNAEIIRALKADAAIGETLYGELVRDAVAARVRAVGEDGFSAQHRERYEAQLKTARDPDYARDEKKAWDEMAKQRFTAGRQAQPKDPADTPRSQLPKDVPGKPASVSSEGQESTLPTRTK